MRVSRRDVFAGGGGFVSAQASAAALPPSGNDVSTNGRVEATRFGLDPAAPDNSKALKTALDHCNESGEILVIPPGRYVFNSFDPAGTQNFCVLVQLGSMRLTVECLGVLAIGDEIAES